MSQLITRLESVKAPGVETVFHQFTEDVSATAQSLVSDTENLDGAAPGGREIGEVERRDKVERLIREAVDLGVNIAAVGVATSRLKIDWLANGEAVMSLSSDPQQTSVRNSLRFSPPNRIGTRLFRR